MRCICQAALLLLAFSLQFTNRGLAGESRPNMIFILVDDLGWSDLGSYGNPWFKYS